MPAPADSNSPAYWYDGQLRIFNSANMPLLSSGYSQFLPMETETPEVHPDGNLPLWIEAAWLDDDGTLYVWYHHEPAGLCAGKSLTAPWIGAAISTDGGRTFLDMGKIIEAAEAPNCEAKNGFFAGGQGDFSVAVDSRSKFIYFYFSTYGGELADQGVAVARLAFDLRGTPAGNVWKYREGEWNEPGLRGRVTPVFRARAEWQGDKTDSFWGPSLHWNHHLESWVMLLNHSCCTPDWPQEGIYASFNSDVGNPAGWSEPAAILKDIGFGPGWYPQVLGTGIGETDKLAGQVARLYVHGVSRWEIVFHRTDGLSAPPPPPAQPAPLPAEPADPVTPKPPEDGVPSTEPPDNPPENLPNEPNPPESPETPPEP